MHLSHIKQAAPQRTFSGEEHGLVKVLANSVPFNNYQRFKEKDRPTMEKLHKDQAKMVKCQYINKRGKDERREASYCAWDGDPILSYRFIPEYEYEIPRGLIDQINSMRRKRRSDLLDKNGKPLLKDEEEAGDDLFVPVNF